MQPRTTFSARVVAASPSLPGRAIGIAIGLRLIGHALRLVGLLVGVRTRASVVLGPAGVEVRSCTEVMGVPLYERHDLFPVTGVTAVGRETVAGATMILAGLVGLAALVIFGASTAFYGFVGRSGSLIGFGLSVITLGVLGDVGLFFTAAARRSRGRDRVHFVAAGRRLVLGSVPRRDAEAFVRAIGERLAEARNDRPIPGGSSAGE